MAELEPAFALQLAIGRAGRVGMNAEAARQLAGRGQALAGKHLTRADGENDLRNQLLAQRNFGASVEPEVHGGLSVLRFASVVFR